jgi:hypothetical protein
MNVTIEEMRIKVCEWMGWTCDKDGYWTHPVDEMRHFPGRCSGCPPPLTLDWLHECWLKLTLTQKQVYLRNLSHTLACSAVHHCNIFDLVEIEDATAEQRLTALYKTVCKRIKTALKQIR